jgi:FkbM family methyltransferase
MLFADGIADNLKIYSFEPNPAVFEILSANSSLCKADVKLFNCGLADDPKTASFTFFPGFSLLSGFYADAHKEKAVVKTYLANQEKTGLAGVSALLQEAEEILDERFRPQSFTARLDTLSAIIEAEKIDSIDLLKINVEKSEPDVLNGIKDGDWAKIKQIVSEVDSEENVSIIVSLLERHGFEYTVEQEPVLAGTELRYIYAVRPAKAGSLVQSQRNAAPQPPARVSEDGLLSGDTLKLWVREKLPDYMVPSAFVFLDALPLTPNGKLDRRSLPAPDAVAFERKDLYLAPRTATEQRLAEIWIGVLSVKEVGIHENFFELGGHSLLAIQLVSRIRDAFQIELPLRTLFDQPTIAGLGESIETLVWAGQPNRASIEGESEPREEMKF